MAESFYNKMVSAAVKAQRIYKVPASITIAQGILESDWGRSELATQARNFFGIKADVNWKGPAYVKKTKEFINGKEQEVFAPFRAYCSIDESAEDHAKFLLKPRYNQALKAKDYKEYARAIHRAGYATDPNYADKLIHLIEGYQLAKYDWVP